MHRVTTYIYEIIVSAFIMGLGLLYLTYQNRTTERLIEVAQSQVIENGDLYQQYNTVDINLLPYERLYSIIMGIREYPIVVDGNIVETDSSDYSTFFSYIREGYYKKTYTYDLQHNIVQIVFTYLGV